MMNSKNITKQKFEIPPQNLILKTMSREFQHKRKYHSYVGVQVDIGDRSHMEDEFAIALEGGLSYFGVYDGHAGNMVLFSF